MARGSCTDGESPADHTHPTRGRRVRVQRNWVWSCGSRGYLACYADQLAPHQASASDPNRGYYSFDIGSWHVVALNSECSRISGGCGQGGAQNDWLEGDRLVECVLHDRPDARAAVRLKGQRRRAESHPQTVLGRPVRPRGRDHAQQRQALLRALLPHRTLTATRPNCVEQWVVGTGGKSHGGLAPSGSRRPTADCCVVDLRCAAAHAEERQLRLAIPGRRFSPFTDSGTSSCH